MSRLLVTTLALATVGCGGIGNEIVAQKRVLTSSSLTFDAGMKAVDTEEEVSFFLQSEATGVVTIYSVEVDDPAHWILSEEWKTEDCDEDGVLDCQSLEGGGSVLDPIYSGPLVITFRPDSEDEFRTVLTIKSDDTEVVERDPEDDRLGIWRVVLRGIGRYPCAQVYPTFMDFGLASPGSFFQQTVTVSNCGVVRLTIDDFLEEGANSFGVDSAPPIYVLPGGLEDFDVSFEAVNNDPAKGKITPLVNDPDFDQLVKLSGNDCTYNTHPDCGEEPEASTAWADDDGDGFSEAEGDCNDRDPTVYPGAEEIEDTQDNDCDGFTDEGFYSFDDDADGYADLDDPADCDDRDPWAFPGANEDCDGRDNDCDGLIDEGEDDTPDGACSFVVERDLSQQDPGGCSTLAAAPAGLSLLLAAVGAVRRRRREV